MKAVGAKTLDELAHDVACDAFGYAIECDCSAESPDEFIDAMAVVIRAGLVRAIESAIPRPE